MLDACRELMAGHFPFLSSNDIELILWTCSKNEGLFCLPEDKPEYLFGYWRFWPVLTQAVEEHNFSILLECDLKTGPMCYVAAMIAPRDGYRLTRQLLDAIQPPPYVFCCHRRNIGDDFRFQMKLNPRRARRAVQ